MAIWTDATDSKQRPGGQPGCLSYNEIVSENVYHKIQYYRIIVNIYFYPKVFKRIVHPKINILLLLTHMMFYTF